MKTYDQIVAELDAKIPREAVSERDAGQGRSLSYLAGHYVIDRLNKVLGQGAWSYNINELRLVHSGEVNGKHVAHYVSIISFIAKLADKVAHFEEVGYGDGMDARNPGKAHELAVKEAITDAIKRAAKNLGMSMGLALYDKDQSNVQEAEPAPKAAPRIASTSTPASGPDKEKLIKKIGLTGRILMDKKVLTLDQLKQKLTEKGVDRKEDLTFTNAEALDKELSALLGA